MKKVFLFGAMLSAFALVGCVDSNESASVEAVRNSKAEEQKALAAMYNAQAAAATTQAQTEAALAQAQAALIQAQAALAQAEAEAQKIRNEYEKDKNNIELQKLLAQAEAAKAAAEQQIQQIKDQMELAVINQQKAIAQAQLALKQALANLKAEDAREFQTYSYAYTSALNDVYNLQSWLANAKHNLELYKINNNLETQLADNGKFVEGQIARYEGYIANNEQAIERLKKQLPELEAQLKMLSECEECKAGDLTALQIKLNEKTHEYEHALDAYDKKHGGILTELTNARNSAQNAMYYSQAGQALREAVGVARKAMDADEFYKLVNDAEIKVDETTTFDIYDIYNHWGDLGLTRSSGDWDTTYKKTWEYVVAKAEYVNWLGDTKTVEYLLSEEFPSIYCPYELSASYNDYKSADQIRLAKEKYEKQYADQLKDADYWIATNKWNEAQYTKYAQRMEAAAKSDSVAIDRKNYTDSLQLTLHGDSVKIDTVDVFTIPAYQLDVNNYYNYSCKYLYSRANTYRQRAINAEKNKEYYLNEQAAYTKFVDMIENSEDYAAEYAKKVDAYFAAMEAYVKDYAEADVKWKAFDQNRKEFDEEWKAVTALEIEKNALQAAYEAMLNNNYKIENFETQIKDINDRIALYEEYIEGYNASIEEAKATGKVNEDRIKLNYENMIASYEADIKNYEEQIAVKQAVVDMYKAILDSLVAEDAE